MGLSFSPEKGMAMVLVLVFTAALLVMGTALISFAVNENLIAGYNALDIRLYYIAEAGVEAGIALLQDDFYYNSIVTGSLGEGSYNVTFRNIDTFSRDIVSVGSLQGYSRTLSVTMELNSEPNNSTTTVRQWHKPYPLR